MCVASLIGFIFCTLSSVQIARADLQWYGGDAVDDYYDYDVKSDEDSWHRLLDLSRSLMEGEGEGEGDDGEVEDGDTLFPTPSPPTPATPTPAVNLATPAPSPSGMGECIGNDSRCKGSSEDKCRRLGRQGSDCAWEVVVHSTGTCFGNDSRCKTGNQATCIRLSKRGADCRWDSIEFSSGSPGTCLGRDSRCEDSSAQRCTFFERQGADCKWRAAFSVTGSLVMAVTKSEGFVNNPDARAALRKALAKLTSVPPKYIDIDLIAETRRLRARSLSQAGNLIVTYAIVVTGDAPRTINVTGVEVGEKLQASNLHLVESAVSTNIEETLGSSFSDISIASVVVPEIIETPFPTQAPQTPMPPALQPVTSAPPTPPSPIVQTPEPPMLGFLTPAPPTSPTATPEPPMPYSPTPAPPLNLSETPSPPPLADNAVEGEGEVKGKGMNEGEGEGDGENVTFSSTQTPQSPTTFPTRTPSKDEQDNILVPTPTPPTPVPPAQAGPTTVKTPTSKPTSGEDIASEMQTEDELESGATRAFGLSTPFFVALMVLELLH